MPPSAESSDERTERSPPTSGLADWLSRKPCLPLGNCEHAVPHASVTSARYCTAVSRRLRKMRKSSPVKIVFICESSWNVVGSTAWRMKKMQLLLTK